MVDTENNIENVDTENKAIEAEKETVVAEADIKTPADGEKKKSKSKKSKKSKEGKKKSKSKKSKDSKSKKSKMSKEESNLHQSQESDEMTLQTEASEGSSSSGDERRVSFGGIHVREFERIVGDHPDTRVGVPLSIGWGYVEKQGVSIERYEADRIHKPNLRMSSITRKNILHNVFGIPEDEIRSAEKEVQKIKQSRQHSAKQSKVGAKAESAVKSWKRKVRKVLNAEKFMQGLAAATSHGMMMSMSHQ